MPLKAWRYRWLLKRGFHVDTLVNVSHVDDLFSNPPVTYKHSSKLIMRRGLSTRTLRFRSLDVEQLREALLELTSSE